MNFVDFLLVLIGGLIIAKAAYNLGYKRGEQDAAAVDWRIREHQAVIDSVKEALK